MTSITSLSREYMFEVCSKDSPYQNPTATIVAQKQPDGGVLITIQPTGSGHHMLEDSAATAMKELHCSLLGEYTYSVPTNGHNVPSYQKHVRSMSVAATYMLNFEANAPKARPL